MNKINYQKKLDELLEKEKPDRRLMLHSCCAPCSSYVLEYLAQHFLITVLYYNPNMDSGEEFERRQKEQIRLVKNMGLENRISVIPCTYDPDEFYSCIKGMEKDPEGGRRCFACYELRLRKTVEMAKEQGFDYFTTTLSISPLKNAGKINEIGERLAQEYGIPHLPSDFKKRSGYKRSVELSQQYDLYRQDYCGCIFSKNQRSQNG